tara:strand:+ start:3058 stop:3858 length:801 start_codon:yes stop_codon:yes gene_type:complete
MKSFLKWAGGKSKVVSQLKPLLRGGKRLVEPFVGSGALFLDSDYEEYLLCDTNSDLINLYLNLQKKGEELIKKTEMLFLPQNNTSDRYYEFRARFNALSGDDIEKSALFIYLNRHAFNGLCRYNKKGAFNVPFGKYHNPKFPVERMIDFSIRARKAEFKCQDFRETFKSVRADDVIYCDPPYIPLSETSSFTSYSKDKFDLSDHADLAKEAIHAKRQGSQCLISNHDLDLTRELYREALIYELLVQRNIASRSASRLKIAEIVAVF